MTPQPFQLTVLPKGFTPTPEMIADEAARMFFYSAAAYESMALACEMAGFNATEGAECLKDTPEAYLAELQSACRGEVIVARQRAASAILAAVVARHCPVCTDPQGEPPPVTVTL